MPDSNKRVDLTGDLSQLGEDILNDVRAATDEVLSHQAAQKKKEEQRSARKKSRQISAVLIAIGAVLVLLVSYWVVFGREAREQAPQSGPAYTSPADRSRAANPPIKTPATTKNSGSSSSRVAPGGRDPQSVQHPPDEYEQPWNKPGM